jgi:DNA ligase-1
MVSNSNMEKLVRVSEILSEIKGVSGSNAKKAILERHRDNDTLKAVLEHGLDQFTPFNVVKVPKTKERNVNPSLSDSQIWQQFFNAAKMCAERTVTGNAAVALLQITFSSCHADDEVWMRKILKKHLSIGASTKTVNKVFPGLVPTFEVSLAHKFDMKRIVGMEEVVIEPKLDGIRCFAIVSDGVARLFARSGKLITNFDSTIGKQLLLLGDGCYDGELMGNDFISLMRQAYRKDDVDVSSAYLALFDFLPLEEWIEGKTKMSCHARREELLDRLCKEGVDLKILEPVERQYIDVNYDDIKRLHDGYVAEGYEGVMIKDPAAPYRFGRGYEVMKLKAFHDADLKIKSLEEGTGKHVGKLGSVTVEFNGVDVRVGSGFSDEQRDEVWRDPDGFVGRMIEVRYQEVTPDGSLRFPTFVCFRNDR